MLPRFATIGAGPFVSPAVSFTTKAQSAQGMVPDGRALR